MKYDAVIVGSGVAGMTAAVILAKEGRNVIVVEQHARPGGLMQSFRRGGHRFPTGVHSVGSLGEGQILLRYFKYLGVFDRLALIPMDRDGFQEYSFPGMSFLVPCGPQAFRSRLIEYFPSERAAVDTFMNDMKKAVAKFSLYNLDARNEEPPTESLQQPLQPYLDRLTDSRELKAVLSAINPMYGVPPSQCPLYEHFLVMDSFLGSAWRIDERRASLAQAFTNALRDSGGEISCGSMVQSIECANGQVQSVTLNTGEIVDSDLVVFTGHPKQLINICPEGSLRPAFKTRINDSPDTPGAFGVAITWKGVGCPVSRCDAFIYDSWDTGAQYDKKILSSRQRPNMVFCSSSPTAEDGGYALTALCCSTADEWAAWENSKTHRRPDAYTSAKNSLATRVISILKEKWPEADGNMSMVDSFTPLTFRDYTLAPGGTAYGLSKSVDTLRSSRVGPTTKIKGLFVAGQSVILPGILGSVISSVAACGHILGRDYLLDRILEETK